jgi:mRNA interferase MazF
MGHRTGREGLERPLKGDVVVVPFPFTDLSATKRRPALVVAAPDDLILCQITSAFNQDDHSISLSSDDFKEGSLHLTSMIRANRLFTADRSIVLYCAGRIKESKMRETEDALIRLLT